MHRELAQVIIRFSNATLECACGKSIYGRGFNMNFVRPPVLSGKGRLGEIRIQA